MELVEHGRNQTSCLEGGVLQTPSRTSDSYLHAPKLATLPGFEPGILDSKSRVLTSYTIGQLFLNMVEPVGIEPTTSSLQD